MRGIVEARTADHVVVRKSDPLLYRHDEGGSWVDSGNEESFHQVTESCAADVLLAQAVARAGAPTAQRAFVVTVTSTHHEGGFWENEVRVTERVWVAEEPEDEKGDDGENQDEEVGDSEENPQVTMSTTAVETSILLHPLAGCDELEEEQNEALKLLLEGASPAQLYKGRSIKQRVGSTWAYRQIVRKHVTSYLDFTTTATLRFKGRVREPDEAGTGGVAVSCGFEAGQIITSSKKGVPRLGGKRNWLVMGVGMERSGRGKRGVVTVTLQGSGINGWDEEIYGDNEGAV